MDKKRMKKKKKESIDSEVTTHQGRQIGEKEMIKRNNTQIIITYYEYTKCDYSKQPNLSVKYNNTKIELIKVKLAS